jgi:hypothetical protein
MIVTPRMAAPAAERGITIGDFSFRRGRRAHRARVRHAILSSSARSS